MNKILKEFGLAVDGDLCDIEWQASKSNKKTILFYQYHPSQKAYDEFIQRIENSDYGILITSGLEKETPFPNHYNLSSVEFMDLQLRLCKARYPFKKDLKFIGITGTNGKTTTVHFISSLLMQKELSYISIGTLGITKNGVEVENLSMTTPPLIDFYKILNKHSVDVDFIVMELSSHSLVQERVKGINFDSTGWTSFSQDHLDYHKTIEDYFNAKKLITKISKTPLIVSSKASDFHSKIEYKQKYQTPFNFQNSFLKIHYNQINLDVAIGCLESCGVRVTLEEIEKLTAPEGRFNLIENNEQSIVIDFAHTPDAIENICKESKYYFNKDIVTIFGCGGDRDKSKRPQMLMCALLYSTIVIVTSDNPRNEEPEDIIKDIVKGSNQSFVKTIIDRKEAIEFALKEYKKAAILILGKGHEPYLEIKGVKYPFSDEKVVRDYLNDTI